MFIWHFLNKILSILKLNEMLKNSIIYMGNYDLIYLGCKIIDILVSEVFGMRGKLAKNLKKVLAIVLVFAMVFCTNSFNNLSRVYAEGSEGESTTSITENIEESENEESTTESTEPEDETTTTTETSESETSESETSEAETSESETSEAETSESETSESETSVTETSVTSESDTSATEDAETKVSSEVVKEETATVSEIEEVNSLATMSEIKLDYDKLDSFSQLTFYT